MSVGACDLSIVDQPATLLFEDIVASQPVEASPTPGLHPEVYVFVWRPLLIESMVVLARPDGLVLCLPTAPGPVGLDDAAYLIGALTTLQIPLVGDLPGELLDTAIIECRPQVVPHLFTVPNAEGWDGVLRFHAESGLPDCLVLMPSVRDCFGEEAGLNDAGYDSALGEATDLEARRTAAAPMSRGEGRGRAAAAGRGSGRGCR